MPRAVPSTGPDEAQETPSPAGWRLFVAIDLPTAIKDVLIATAEAVPPGLRDLVRWSRPGSTHLTVHFLGDVDPGRVDEISARVTDAAGRSARFMLRLDGVGAFPSLREPRVLWAGIDGELPRLRQLHGRLEGALARAGFESERRRYNPHLTVGRLRREIPEHDARVIGASFASAVLPDPRPEFEVDALVLYRSTLLPEGPQYEALARADLG